jgi:hypothetical protein
MDELEIEHVHYGLALHNEKLYSICENMLDNRSEIVPAWSIIKTAKQYNNVSDYDHYINCCEKMGLKNINSSIDNMIVVDYIIANTDRHYNNFGIIRDSKSLEPVKIAPLFDSGGSLWFDQNEMDIDFHTIPCRSFNKDHEKNIKHVRKFYIDITKLSKIDEITDSVLRQNKYITDGRRSVICYGIKDRVKMLERHMVTP